MHVMIVGASGAMAAVAIRDLLESVNDLSITALDSRPSLANDARVRTVILNVEDELRLARCIENHDVVVNCLPYHLNLPVMRAALQVRVPYTDLGGLYHGTLQQLALHEAFVHSGLTAVLGMGSTPGITNVMAGALAAQMDRVEEIHVRVACQDEAVLAPLPIPYSLDTILDEFSLDPQILRDGQVIRVPPLSGSELINFPPPVGTAETRYALHSEVAMFPYSFPGLKEASFKIAFPQGFTRNLKLLVELGFASSEPLVRDVSPREMLLALSRKQRAPELEPRDCDVLRVEVKGSAQGSTVHGTAQSIILPDRAKGISAGALDTGVPLSIVAQMLATGHIRNPGVLCPETSVPPEPFFRQLERRGIQVSFSWRNQSPRSKVQSPTSKT